MLKAAGLPADKVDAFYRPPKKPEGVCPNCGGLGYRGRMGVFELLAITERLRDMIREGAPVTAIRSEARKNGMDLIGIFHSHPDCDAYFSKTDLENSCPWYSFVVLSIQKGQFHHANSWLPNMEQTEAAKEELEHPNA